MIYLCGLFPGPSSPAYLSFTQILCWHWLSHRLTSFQFSSLFCVGPGKYCYAKMSSSALSCKVFLYNIFGGVRAVSRGRILSSTKPYQAGTAQAHVLSQAGTVVGIVRQLCLCMWKRSCYIPMLSVLPIVLMCMRLLQKYRYYCRLKIKHILTVICLCVYYSSYSMDPINYTFTALQLGRTVGEGH
jgi:hypothetical protein